MKDLNWWLRTFMSLIETQNHMFHTILIEHKSKDYESSSTFKLMQLLFHDFSWYGSQSLRCKWICAQILIIIVAWTVKYIKLNTSLISSHISLADIPWELPDITKQGQSETWTPLPSWAAIAYVTGGNPLAVLII